MRDIPRLSWLGGKTFSQSAGSRKNRPGLSVEHQAALSEQFCAALDKQELAENSIIAGESDARQEIEPSN